MNGVLAIGILSAFLSGGVALMARFRDKPSRVRNLFVVGMELLCAENVLALFAILSQPEDILLYHRVRYILLAVVPAPWLAFSLAYARGDVSSVLSRARWWLALAVAAPLAPALLWRWLAIPMEDAPGMLRLGTAGTAVHGIVVILLAVVIMNLERTLRASTGTMRWRVKFVVLGLVVLFAGRIYTLMEDILYSTVAPSPHVLASSGAVVGCLLLGLSLKRSRLQDADLYVSSSGFLGSLTMILIGVYFLAVGFLAHLSLRFDAVAAVFPIIPFVLFLGMVAWAVASLSDRVRRAGQRLAAHYARRPLYDYRQILADFASQTAAQTDAPSYCRAATDFVSDTLGVLSVTVWLVDTRRQRLVPGGSTLLSDAQAQALLETLPPDTPPRPPPIERLKEPLDIDTAGAPHVELLRRLAPSQFHGKGGHRLCVALNAGGETLGLMMLCDRIRGAPYTAEETALLKTMASQIGARLLNIRVAQGLLESRELSAFQAMSSFFVHDLKNTAASLSLTLQNLPKHFADPAFRDDALRSISRSVEKINNLIRRFSQLNQTLDIHPVATDINAVVRRGIADLNDVLGDAVTVAADELPPVQADPEQIQKVVTNLLLNAREASGPTGVIDVRTACEGAWVTISVTDRGCGMPAEFVEERLFKPFCSMKPNGMGIGLFHSRAIVEAHRGCIDVHSEAGKGSTFRVLLPSRG